MYNSAEIAIFGYVGKDPIVPSTNHLNFITFPVGVTTKRKDKATKEEIKTTAWFECQTSNESVAILIKKYIKLGMGIYVRGIPKCDVYLDKDNKPQASIKINITAFKILVDPKNNEQTNNVNPSNSLNEDFFEEDIPF